MKCLYYLCYVIPKKTFSFKTNETHHLKQDTKEHQGNGGSFLIVTIQ